MQHYPAHTSFKADLDLENLPTEEVLGFDLVNATAAETVKALMVSGKSKVAFLNAHCVNTARRDPQYAAALQRADFILPDGAGIELAAKLAGKRLVANLNGTDFVPILMKEAARQGKRVFLLGGKPGTAAAAAARISLMIPGLQVVGTCDGYGQREQAIHKINASGADILLVAMGVPLQDVWIDENFDRLTVKLALGVGALLDFWAGNVPRAPEFMRKSRMEWVWRLAMEPKRLANRYLLGNFSFVAHALLQNLMNVERQAIFKRMADIAISLSALVLLSPVLLVTCIAVLLESRGSPVFRQTRVGKNGREFTVFKFRSMYTDAEARLAEVRATSDREGTCFKSKTDPRITRVGRVLRRLSIDELPQIVNVLLGQMSIVGPRPGLPSEVAEYDEIAMQRLEAKPGLTGLWQVSGRADIGFDQMIAMDVAYVRSRSMLLDWLIIGLTFRTVFSGRGAY